MSPFRSKYGDIVTAIRYSHTPSRHRFLPSSFLALALFVILLDAGYSSARCQASAKVGPLPSYSMNTVNPSTRTRSFLCLRLPGAFLFQAEFQWSFRPCRPLTSPRVVVSTAISGPFRPGYIPGLTFLTPSTGIPPGSGRPLDGLENPLNTAGQRFTLCSITLRQSNRC